MKKLLLLMSFIFVLIGLVGCKDTDKVATTDPEQVSVPQFASAIARSGETENSIKILVNSEDEDATVYYIVIDEDATNPTAEQIKAGVNYGTVTIYHKGSATGSIVEEKSEGLTGGTTYKVAFIVEKDAIFSTVVTRTATSTSAEDLVDRGDGTLENPFWVENAADLAKVGSSVDEWHPTVNYILKNDIDLKAAGYDANGESWIPIGNLEAANAKFSGVFDGNGFTISNLYINHTEGGEKVGLFYEVDVEGVIKNLHLTDVNITANALRVGGIVGYSKGTIENVSVVGGTITTIDVADSQSGGIVGTIYEVGILKNAYSNVSIISSGRRSGGIVGSIDASDNSTENIVVSNVYALGNVIGTTKDARQLGGVVGFMRNTTMENVYAAGNIIGSEQIGGVVGFMQKRASNTNYDGQPTLKNTFYIGNQILATGELDGTTELGSIVGLISTSGGTVAVLENNYGVDSVVLIGSVNTVEGETSVPMANFIDTTWLTSHLSGFDFVTTWELITDATRPVVKGLGDTGQTIVHESSLLVYTKSADAGDIAGDLVVTIKTNKLANLYYVVVAKEATAPTAEQVKAGVNYDTTTVLATGNALNVNELTETKAMANGTEYDVYIYAEQGTEVTDVALVTGTSKILITVPIFGDEDTDLLGYYPIYLLSDLEIYRDGINDGTYSNTSTFKLMNDIDMSSDYGVDGKNWSPLGNISTKWKGTFDGQDYTINGLYIDLNEENVGFFGVVDPGGIIKNVHFTNVFVQGKKLVGTLIGYGKPNLVENVSVVGGEVISTDIADSRVGGLIGRLAQANTNSFIQLSWTDVSVSGSKFVGGLVGHSDYASNTTNVITIQDVYTLGDATGTGDFVGGVVGWLRTNMQRAIAYGSVTGNKIGGVAGYVQNTVDSLDRPHASIDDALALNSALSATTEYYRVASISSSKGEILSQTNLYALDTLTGGTDGTDVSATNAIDVTWLEANTTFNMTTIWQIVEGIIVLR